MDKLQAIRGIAFDLDGTLVDSAPGLTSAVDNALYALELPVAGEERVVTWIGNGADVLMERGADLGLVRSVRRYGRRWVSLPSTIMIFRKTNSCAFLRKLFDRYYAETAEEGSFPVPGGGRYARRAACQRPAAGAGHQ